MTKLYYIILFLSLNIQAQNISWKKIFSGDIAAYKENNIKTALLLKDNKVINRIEVFSDKNELVTSTETATSWLKYDAQNRISRIVTQNKEFTISYFENGMIQSVEKMENGNYGIDLLKNSRVSSENLKSIDYESSFFNKKTGSSESNRKKRFVYNPKDSLLSFWEDIYAKGYVRNYLNHTEVRKSIDDHGFEIDSVYQSGGKEFRYNFRRKDHEDIITKKYDSLYTEVYHRGQIVGETVQHSRTLYEENFYNSPEVIKKKYIYRLADDHTNVLWEIRKTYKNGKVKSEFPLRKYYDLRDDRLVRNKKKLVTDYQVTSSCGGAIYNKKQKLYFPEYHVYSPSILFSDKLKQRIFDNLDFVISNDLEIVYNKMNFDGMTKDEDFFGENFALYQSFYKYYINFITKENYTVEIETSDGKKYRKNFKDISTDFSLILNIFGISEYK